MLFRASGDCSVGGRRNYDDDDRVRHCSAVPLPAQASAPAPPPSASIFSLLGFWFFLSWKCDSNLPLWAVWASWSQTWISFDFLTFSQLPNQERYTLCFNLVALNLWKSYYVRLQFISNLRRVRWSPRLLPSDSRSCSFDMPSYWSFFWLYRFSSISAEDEIAHR